MSNTVKKAVKETVDESLAKAKQLIDAEKRERATAAFNDYIKKHDELMDVWQKKWDCQLEKGVNVVGMRIEHTLSVTALDKK